MNSSAWLTEVKAQFTNNTWPAECVRCKETEEFDNTSIRLNSIQVHNSRVTNDYLHVSGVLDNICNSACQFCGPELSTKIGSLLSPTYEIYNNSDQFWKLPLDRIEHLDINGGEPSASKNYKKVLQNLPKNLRTLRVNTNCSKIIDELAHIQKSGVEVTVTVSFDGTELVHDYVRWPIEWSKFLQNLFYYKEIKLHAINLWTTVNTLNIGDMENIFNFVDQHEFDHSFAFLKTPAELNIEYENYLTLAAKKKYENHPDNRLQKLSSIMAIKSNNQVELNNFIHKQDQLRNISIQNFINIY
jgi:MoaA/NifB/PqqE/SkfB family radical SAM enzyme